MLLVEANLSVVKKCPTEQLRAIQAQVKHVLAAAKIKESKGLAKYHTMIMGVGKGRPWPFPWIFTHSLINLPNFKYSSICSSKYWLYSC